MNEERAELARRYWGQDLPDPDPIHAESTLREGTFGHNFMAYAEANGLTPSRLVAAVTKAAQGRAALPAGFRTGRDGVARVGSPDDVARALAGIPPTPPRGPILQGEPDWNLGAAWTGEASAQSAGMDNRLMSAQMGPGTPPPPAPLGGDPRMWQYRVGYNLPTSPDIDRGVDAALLRTLADSYDLLRRCIEIRKREVQSLEWQIIPTVTNRSDREKWMEDNADTLNDISRFFMWPEAYFARDGGGQLQRRGILGWGAWVGALMEDYYVGDWLTIWPRVTLGGDVFSLERVAGENIKPLLDIDGRTPTPPYSAYQQYLYGVPRASFTLDELLYRPRNVRNMTQYGYSHVEQMLLLIMLALRFEMWNVQAYTDGSLPLGVLGLPEGYTPEMIEQVIDILNQAAGMADMRQQWRGVPHGTEWVPIKPFQWDQGFATYIIEYTAAMMEVSPTELGFTPTRGSGLGGSGFAEQQDEWKQRQSSRPLALWVQGWHNEIIDRFFGRSDILFSFQGLNDEDDSDDLDNDRKELELGLKTLDQLLQEHGEDPVGVNRFVLIGQTPWFVPDLIAAQEGTGRIGGPAPGLPTSADVTARNQAMLAGAMGGGPGGAGGPEAITPPGDDGTSPPADDSGQPGPPPTDSGQNLNAPDVGKAASSSDSHPSGVAAAGLAVRAKDTGRVLVLQRALDDPGHPDEDNKQAGKWEFPGGKLDEGESPRTAAIREWEEETGNQLPDGNFGDTWDANDGIYRGHVYEIPSEKDVDIRGDRDVVNPDDPDGDTTEALAWWDPKDLKHLRSLRKELKKEFPEDLLTKTFDTTSGFQPHGLTPLTGMPGGKKVDQPIPVPDPDAERELHKWRRKVVRTLKDADTVPAFESDVIHPATQERIQSALEKVATTDEARAVFDREFALIAEAREALTL